MKSILQVSLYVRIRLYKQILPLFSPLSLGSLSVYDHHLCFCKGRLGRLGLSKKYLCMCWAGWSRNGYRLGIFWFQSS